MTSSNTAKTPMLTEAGHATRNPLSVNPNLVIRIQEMGETLKKDFSDGNPTLATTEEYTTRADAIPTLYIFGK